METRTSTKQYVTVTNRNSGTTGYTLTNGYRRQFAVGQSKEISLDELRELAGIPGGDYLLEHFFIINDQNALDYLNIHTEPEYFYNEEDVKNLLLNGSLDQLEDCLNFAPEGVIELIKSTAVQIKLPDVNKRELILKKTDFNITNALMVNSVLENDKDKAKEEKKATRKSSPIVKQRTETPKYTRVSEKK